MKKIKLLLAAMAAMVGMTANAQLTSGTVYWLQDVGTGQFLSQGDDWSTKAVMKDVGGLGFEAVYVSDGVYTLKNIMWNTVKSTNLGLGADQYVDQTPVNYTLTASGVGFKVSYNGNYLVNNGNENAYKEKPIGKTTDVNAATVWRFLTKTEYDAALQAYYDGRAAAMATSMGLSGITTLSALETEIADASYVKVDQTSKITNPNFSGNWDGWTHGAISQRGTGSGGVGEFWTGIGYAKQTVGSLPNGLYKVTFVGTYRPGSTANADAVTSAKTSSPVFVYANNDKKELVHWIDVSARSNNQGGITTANGYGHTFYTYVTNGTIELGVVDDGWLGDGTQVWCPFGQFTLTQIYSLAMYQAMLAEAVANTSAYNGIIPTAAYDAIQAVVTEKNITWSTAEEYVAAIDAINTAISTYASSDIQNAYTKVLEAKALYNQTDYTDANNAKATFKGYLDAADATTTLSALNTAINDIKSHLLDFVTAVTLDANAYFDLTNFLVVNPTVSANVDGWTTEKSSGNGPTTNFGETEFYNANFKFYQSLTLPRGTWEFGVTGFHRGGQGDYTTYFYAGEDKILIPGVVSSIVNTMAQAQTYFDGGNGKVALKFALEEASNTIEIGIENTDTQTDKWTIFRDFTLKFYGSAIDYSIYEDNWNAAVTAANNAKTAHSDVTVGSEYVALNTALANTPTGTSKADYVTKTNALIDATAAFNLAAPNYPALAREITKAKALGIDAATADSYAATSETTAATALANTQALMVDEYNYVATNYSHAVELGTWNKSSNAGSMTSQHWDGTTTSSYLEQGGGDLAYNLTSWTVTYDQTLSLPAGNYIFKVAGRTATDHVTINLNVTDVTNAGSPVLLGTVNDFPKGDTGLGINTSGETDFTTGEGHTYAYNGNGRGWQWRYVKFTLAAPASVQVAVVAEADAQYRWMSFCNATVQTDDADNVALMQALVDLNDAKAAATLTQRTNVGTGIFQYEATTDDDLWSAYTTAKSNAEAFTLAANTEVEDVTALTTALTNAQTNYSSNAVINAPDASKRYNVSIVDGGQAWDGNAITFVAGGRTDMGNFAVQYLASANAYMCQALKFTAVEGEDNTYKISAIRADGGEQYLTTGSTYEGGNNTQIRTTDDASKASWVKIQPAATSGQFQLLNVSDGNKVIGRNATNPDNGMYTDGNVSFTIAEASQASVTVSCKAGKYGTVIFPFTPDVSTGFDGITFYSAESVNGATQKVQITEVAEPVANVPYLIKNEGGENFSKDMTGWGTATADSYTEDLLTGVYTEATIAAGANHFVLQTQGDVQAFYKVVDTDFTATPYKCYLTYNSGAGAGVKALGFEFRTPTSVRGLEMAEGQNDAIFNLAGQRVQKAQRGLYIVNGKKVLVK